MIDSRMTDNGDEASQAEIIQNSSDLYDQNPMQDLGHSIQDDSRIHASIHECISYKSFDQITDE